MAFALSGSDPRQQLRAIAPPRSCRASVWLARQAAMRKLCAHQRDRV